MKTINELREKPTNRRLNKVSGFSWATVVILALIPIPLWLMIPSALPRFSNFNSITSNLGQLTALVGTTLFAINLILSARPRFLEKYFYNLSRLYDYHRIIGEVALVLLLLHPLLLIPRYTAGHWEKALAFLLPGSNWAQNWGFFALVLMLCLIIVTLYLRPKYNIWKWTHKFLGLAFFLASLHIWFISSDISNNLPLRIYILGISVAGLITFIYKSILGRWLVPQRNFIVSKLTKLNKQVWEISLEPVKNKLNFLPGQYVFVSFFDPNLSSESHPFSISSSPDDKNLTLTIKEMGDFTQKLSQISVGSIAKLEGPFGSFSFGNAFNNRQIWIAGGIGITPFLSMAKALKNFPAYQVELYCCTKTADEVVHMDELQQLATELSGRLLIHTHLADHQNRITAVFIEKTSGLTDKDIFICAPPGMIKALRQQFISKGIPGHAIHSEEFNF